jgi:hypothetical protein
MLENAQKTLNKLADGMSPPQRRRAGSLQIALLVVGLGFYY